MSGDIHTMLPQCWCGTDHNYAAWENGYQYAREELDQTIAGAQALILALRADLERLRAAVIAFRESANEEDWDSRLESYIDYYERHRRIGAELDAALAADAEP